MSDAEKLAERFVRCDADVQAWAEQAGLSNLQGRIESGARIGQQAATTLTLLLAGLGGTLALALPVLAPQPGPVAYAAAALCVYLALLSAVLVVTVIRLRDAPMLHNQPGNLLVPGATLAQLRAGELANIELRIRQQAALNRSRANALDAVRMAAIASPVVAVLGGWLRL